MTRSKHSWIPWPELFRSRFLSLKLSNQLITMQTYADACLAQWIALMALKSTRGYARLEMPR